MPPLMLLAGTLLPEILKIFASDKSDSIGSKVTDVFKNVLQTEDKDTAQQKLESNAIDKAKVQLELAKIAAEAAAEEHRADEERKNFELEVLQDQIAESERARQAEFHRYDLDAQDRNIARNRQSHLEDEESVFAYVAPTLALLITTGLGYFMYLLLTTNTEIQNKDVFNTILGAVTTAFVTIVTFYFGSSVGSKEKDRLITSGQFTVGDNTGSTPPKSAVDGRNSADGQDSLAASADQSGPSKSPTNPGLKPKLPTPTGPYATFRKKAPSIVTLLMKDFNLTDYQASGILGNMGWECAGFRKLQEVNPIGGGAGGLGWLQWTGDRRAKFIEWAENNNFNIDSDEANYGYLKIEMNGLEGQKVLPSLRKSSNVSNATEVFMNIFERPNKYYAALSGRINYANIALSEYRRI